MRNAFFAISATALLSATAVPAVAERADWDRAAQVRAVSAELAGAVRAKGASAVSRMIADCYEAQRGTKVFDKALAECMIKDMVFAYASVEQMKSKATANETLRALNERLIRAFDARSTTIDEAGSFAVLVKKEGLAAYNKAR